MTDSREPQWAAGIVGDIRIINGARGRVALFALDDRSGAVEVAMDEKLYTANKHFVKEDELIVLQGKFQNDRFTGGYRMNATQVLDLAGARCRFGKYLQVTVSDNAPPIQRIVREFPPRFEATEHGNIQRSLGVRVCVKRRHAIGEVKAEFQLGATAHFFPSDAALAAWMAQAESGGAKIVYE